MCLAMTYGYAFGPASPLLTGRVRPNRRCACLALMFFVPFLALIPAWPAGAEEQVTIAVLDFQATNAPASDAAAITQFVRAAVVRAHRYLVVDKSNMDKILGEQAFQQTGCTSQECAVKLGKILNVRKMVVGDYTIVGGIRYLTASLVDVETGQIENAAKEKGFSVSKIDETVDRLVSSLIAARRVGEDEARARAGGGRTARGRVGLGLNIPGLGIRYFVIDNLALEARGQMEKDARAEGLRVYGYIGMAPSVLVYLGGEGDLIQFSGDAGKYSGLAAGGFAGVEVFVWRKLSVQCDFGPAYLRLTDKNGMVGQDGLSYIVNFGINLYFGGGGAGQEIEKLYQEAAELYKAKDYDGAQTKVEGILRQDPENWKAWALLGNCQYAKGDRTGALASFDRSLQINPDNPRLKAWVDNLRKR